MSKAVLVSDFDGVMADTMRAFDEWVRENYKIDFSAPGFSFAALPEEVFRFFHDPALQDVPLLAGAKEGTQRLLETGWELHFRSVRNATIQLATFAYLAKHGIRCDTFSFANGRMSKIRYTAQNGGCALVEDELRHLIVPEHPEVRRILLRSDSRFVQRKNEAARASLAARAEFYPLENIVVADDWTHLLELLEMIRQEEGLQDTAHIDHAKLHL